MLVLAVVINAIILFAQITNISGQTQRRLLTPEEGCGISKVANTKIVGGTESKIGAFPWIAVFGYADMKAYGEVDFKCGGALITSRHILTAAHCIAKELKFVRLGEHKLFTTRDGIHQDIGVIKSVKHPKHNRSDKTNDIAILTLERDVEFTDRIRPICLPLTKELQSKSFVDSNPFAAGWGRLKESTWSSNVLMQVQIPIINNTLCKELYKKRSLVFSEDQFSNGVICAGNLAGGQGTCQGDSGGPLMLPISDKGQFSMYQIGVVSYAFGCARPNTPTVFTRVSHYIDWIQEETSL